MSDAQHQAWVRSSGDAISLRERDKEIERLRGLLLPAYTYIHHFVSVNEAETDGLDVFSWCRAVEAVLPQLEEIPE